MEPEQAPRTPEAILEEISTLSALTPARIGLIKLLLKNRTPEEDEALLGLRGTFIDELNNAGALSGLAENQLQGEASPRGLSRIRNGLNKVSNTHPEKTTIQVLTRIMDEIGPRIGEDQESQAVYASLRYGVSRLEELFPELADAIETKKQRDASPRR